MIKRAAVATAVASPLFVAGPARAEQRTFESGSLIIPMDLSYQDTGMLQAYGLLFQLARQGIAVFWVIDQDKTWHHPDCDTPGELCAWDCGEEGSGVKCPYPTANPDFFAAARVIWDGGGAASPGDTISNHGYRGGPFVIAAGVEWAIGSISGDPAHAGDPSNQGIRTTTMGFPDYGDYLVELTLEYKVGQSVLTETQMVTVRVVPDSDGDGVPDAMDPDPSNPNICGDSDMDTCDDCAVSGTSEPDNDGPDTDSDGICDDGESGGSDSGGCGCSTSSPVEAAPWLLVLGLALFRRRRSVVRRRA